jgi:hypothetical protein
MGVYRSRVSDLLLIPVEVSRPQALGDARARQDPQRRRILVSLVLDTGAGYCSLKPAVIERLDLPLQRRARVHTHVGNSGAGLYAARLAFPLSSLVPLARVLVAGLEMPVNLAAHDGVIGRNVLRMWETLYSGPRRQLTVRDGRSLWGWLFS